jgi:hypothetical protein
MTKSLLKKIVVTCAFLGLASTSAFAFVSRISVVNAFSAEAWNISVPAYQNSRVVVEGDGTSDLDCFVFDAVTGELLGSDTDGTDYCIVHAISRSGRIRVEINNVGSVWNRYEIRVTP